VESLIALFLYKNSPKSYTLTELTNGINVDLADITCIRLYERPINNNLTSGKLPSYIKKTEAYGEPDRYCINNLANINQKDLLFRFSNKIDYLEKLGLILMNIMLDSNVGIQIPSFQLQIEEIINKEIERDDLNVLLRKTFEGHVLYNNSNLTFKLISKKNPIRDQLSLNETIKKGLQSGISEEELLISNKTITSDAIKKIKNRSALFCEKKNVIVKQEYIEKVESPIEQNLSVKSIDEYIERYKNAVNQHFLALQNKYISIEERKNLILSAVSEKQEAKEEIQVWFSQNTNALNRYRGVLGEELFIDVYKYIESRQSSSNELGKVTIDKPTEIRLNEIEKELIEDIDRVDYDFKSEFPNLSKLLPKSLFFANIPTKEDFKTNIYNYEMRLEHAAIEIGISLKEIKKAILCVKNDLEDLNDWELIYRCFKLHINQDDYIFSEAGKMLKRFASNPFSNFLALLESAKENINFNDNPRFKEILTEVCRDNIVTDAERELVFEKAATFGGININKVELYLNNEFRNYPSFILLIDEICEDGIITQRERKFIEEKAKTYKISDEVLSRLLEIGLFKVKAFNKLKSNSDFKDIVVIYLISYSLNFDANFLLKINNEISNLYESVNCLEIDLQMMRNRFLIEFYSQIGLKLNLPLINSRIGFAELLKQLGIATIEFNFEFRQEGGDLEHGLKESIEVQPISISYEFLMKIMKEEKYRIGSPDASLFMENVKFRIENKEI
jgi:hypothetical protein